MLMHLFLYKLVVELERKCPKEVAFILSNFKLLNKNLSPANHSYLVQSFLTSKQLYNTPSHRGTHNFSTSVKPFIMADKEVIGLPLKTVVEKLNLFASTSLAESWDNVGLLVEPVKPKDIKKILLTNDLTEEVVEEAVKLHTDLIISYHPPIFTPLKSLTTRTWKERVIATCVENRIAVYSPHTSFDAVKGGVNDWLASAFDTEEVTPLVPAFKNCNSHLVEVTFPDTTAGIAAAAEFQTKWAENKNRGDGESVCHTTPQTGDFQLSVTCDTSSLTTLVEIFNSSVFGKDKERFRVMKYEKVTIPGHGMGRLCHLRNSLSVQKVVELVKSHIKRPNVKLALAVGKDLSSPISSIAICAGSGASLLRGVKADLYLTGEMLHHDILDAAHTGSHVILCNHSDSERGFLLPFSLILSDELLDGKVQVVVSKKDKDPLITV